MPGQPQPIVPFDAYIGVDWSGAKTANGIAIAVAKADADSVTLVAPPSGARRWTRTAAGEWLHTQMADSRVLVGVDFALSLPSDPALRWADSARDLWRLVDETCAEFADATPAAVEDTDLYARAFVDTAPFENHFWTKGSRPAGFADRSRQTEVMCAALGQGAPQTPFKLIGAKQVGLGSLSGMRVAHRWAQSSPAPFVWPFDGRLPPSTGSVVVEIYPRLFLREAGCGNRKVRTKVELDAALDHFRSRWENPSGTSSGSDISDHDTDALIAACGLRARAASRQTWEAAPPGATVAFEGWIFGVDAANNDTGGTR